MRMRIRSLGGVEGVMLTSTVAGNVEKALTTVSFRTLQILRERVSGPGDFTDKTGGSQERKKNPMTTLSPRHL